MANPRHRFATRAIHAGQSPDPSTGAIMPPIYATSTYVQSSPGVHKGLDYGRSHNPTRWAWERCVADLEGGPGAQAFAFASGLAAIATVLELLPAGSHVVSGDDVYGGSFRLFDKVRRHSAALSFSYVDLAETANLLNALTPESKLVWVETPTNPLLKLADLRSIAELARSRGLITVCDNTFASPYNQRPLELGFDIVVHSATKYLNGHSDVIGGVAVVGADDRLQPLRERLGFLQNSVGAGAMARKPAQGGARVLPRTAFAPAACPCPAATDGRLRRHDFRRTEDRPGRGQAFPGNRAGLCTGRKPGRCGKPDRAPGHHDPRDDSAGDPRQAWHR
jgi:cystathionine gamma-lyase